MNKFQTPTCSYGIKAKNTKWKQTNLKHLHTFCANIWISHINFLYWHSFWEMAFWTFNVIVFQSSTLNFSPNNLSKNFFFHSWFAILIQHYFKRSCTRTFVTLASSMGETPYGQIVASISKPTSTLGCSYL
jgi:hypothetical protein